MDERDADKAALERGLRQAYCLRGDTPAPLRALLDRLAEGEAGSAEAREAEAACEAWPRRRLRAG